MLLCAKITDAIPRCQPPLKREITIFAGGFFGQHFQIGVFKHFRAVADKREKKYFSIDSCSVPGYKKNKYIFFGVTLRKMWGGLFDIF